MPPDNVSAFENVSVPGLPYTATGRKSRSGLHCRRQTYDAIATKRASALHGDRAVRQIAIDEVIILLLIAVGPG